MAHAHKLSEQQSRELARHIGMHPHPDAGHARKKPRRLAEHFECWVLPQCADDDAGRTLQQLAHPTSMIHHQIRTGRLAKQFALSRTDESAQERYELHGVFTSELARKIDAGISLVDRHADTGDDLVRLLIVPRLKLYALWLRAPNRLDRVLVVYKPALRRLLRFGVLYDADVFLEAVHLLSTKPRRAPAAAGL